MSFSMHPAILALRFFLELAALAAMGRFGHQLGQAGALRYVWMVVIPLAAATAWGVFAVPGDESRSGSAPVPVPGAIRLLLELGFFGFAVWGLVRTEAKIAGGALACVTVLLYVLSYDRVRWLLAR